MYKKTEDKGHERRLAALDEQLVAYVTSQAFTEYFGISHFNKLTEVVSPEEKERLSAFLAGFDGNRQQQIFRFRAADGQYHLNMLTLLSMDHMPDGDSMNIELHDLEQLLEQNHMLQIENLQMRTIIGLEEEYTFLYERETNRIHIFQYTPYRRVLLLEADLDEWAVQLLESGRLEPAESGRLQTLILCLKRNTTSLYQELRTSFLHGQNMETVCFSGKAVHFAEDHMVEVGRIYVRNSVHTKEIGLQDELRYDPLTHIFNKKTITDYARSSMKEGNSVALAIIDVDLFKQINDTYGHLYGDEVLTKFANRLTAIIGDTGVAGRIGGDEFLIVMQGVEGEQALRSMLRSIRTQIKWEFANDHAGLTVTCSIGAATYPEQGTDYEEVFRHADFCLYRAKEKGKDRYVFFRRDVHQEAYELSCREPGNGPLNQVRQIQELELLDALLADEKEARYKKITAQERFQLAAEKIMQKHRIDRISYYGGGPDWKLLCRRGMQADTLQDASYVESEEFRRLRINRKTLQIGFVSNLREEMPDFYKRMTENQVCSTIQCLAGPPDHPTGLLVFDKCTEESQWADYEVHLAGILASILELIQKQGETQ